MSLTAEQHEARSQVVGGSDVADLLDLAPFGCERKLYYDKRGIAPDFANDLDENIHVRRGSVLEDIAINEFCRSKEYGLIERAPAMVKHPKYPFMGAHLDAIVMKTGSVTRVACENKIPSAANFVTIKFSGKPPESWIAQLRYSMLCAGLKLGVLSVFNPDKMESLEFPVMSDPAMERDFIAVADRFWNTVTINPENPFPVKSDDYAACQRCPWRKTCKGMGRMASVVTEEDQVDLAVKVWVDDLSLLPLATAYLEAKAARKECEAEEERLKKELDAALDGRAVNAGGVRIWWQTKIVNYKAQPKREAEQRKQRSLKVIEG